MNVFYNIISNKWVQRAFWSVVVVLLGLLIYRLTTGFLNSKEKKDSKILSSKKNKTFIRMLKSVIGTTLAILVVLTVLQIFGVNVTSMLAGVGIASIVIGFALQDALKDIIRGFEIVSDSYYEIGDVIKYGNNVGQVLSITLRTTKIQDINTMNIVSIANRNIDQVEIVSGYVYIPITLPYDVKIDKADSVMKEIVKKLEKHENITSAIYQGISDLTNSSRNHQICITCDPINQLQIRRDALRIIIETLEKNHISIAHTQLDIHTSK